MHISEGVLSIPALAAGGALALGGLAMGLRRLKGERLMTVAILSATFFVGSLIHVPIGVSSVHLVLNGLMGLILGWATFPAIFVGLLLQALFFQFGGLTVLGVNTVDMALPAVVFGMLARPFLFGGRGPRLAAAFSCGALSVAGAALLTATFLVCTGEDFLMAAKLLVLGHVPVMVAEGIITMLTVAFLARACPEILHFPASKE